MASALAGAGLLSGCAGVSAGNHEAAAASKISVVPSSVDFKEVVVGLKNTQTLQVTNNGEEPIDIEGVHVSGQAFTLSSARTPMTLAPKASFPVTVAFAPTTAVSVSGALVVSGSDVKSQVTVPLAGTGQKALPQLEVVPASLNFGSTTVHTSVTQNVSLKNTGNVPITIDSVAVSNPAYSATGLSSGVSLAPSQSLPFNLTFRPATAGAASATLSVGSANLTAPTTVNLSGAGANSPSTTAPSANPPAPSAPSANPPAPSAPTANPPAPSAPSANPPSTTTPAPAPLVTLTWNASTSSVVGYHLYRSAVSGGPYTRISGSVITAVDYQDTDVQAGSSYFYVVTALDADGTESAFSNEASASVPSQ